MSESSYRIVHVPRITAGAYLILGGESVLVDTGMRGNAKKLLNAARAHGGSTGAIAHILLTHWHIDHTGSARTLRAKCGALVYAHVLDAPYITGQRVPSLATTDTRRTRFVEQLLQRLYKPCPVDRVVGDGEPLPVAGGIDVLHMPGHTGGSVCYYHRATRSLFLGDVLLRRHGPWALPAPQFTDDMEQARQSLRRLADIPVDACYFGHGEPVLLQAQERLRDAICTLTAAPPDGSPS